MDRGEREPAITLELADPAATVVHVRGELDLGAAQRFHSVLTQAARGQRCVIVDLSECSFIDSVSIGVMLTARRKSALPPNCRSPLAVVAGGAVARTLELVGAERAEVPVLSTVDEAKSAVGSPD